MPVEDDIAAAFLDGDGPDTERSLSMDPIDGSHAELRRSGDNAHVGNLCRCPTYGCKAYWTVRNPMATPPQILTTKNAYAIDERILFELDAMGAEKVFIGQTHDRSVLEFDLDQYLDCGEDGKIDHDGPQRYVRVEEAVAVWPDALGTVFQA